MLFQLPVGPLSRRALGDPNRLQKLKKKNLQSSSRNNLLLVRPLPTSFPVPSIHTLLLLSVPLPFFCLLDSPADLHPVLPFSFFELLCSARGRAIGATAVDIATPEVQANVLLSSLHSEPSSRKGASRLPWKPCLPACFV